MITPPVIGRISIGQIIEKNGKRLPKKDDQFTVTSQIQTSNGWIKHPLDEQLRTGTEKLREIPVQLVFNEPELNLRAEYCLFDHQTARPICVGNGESCQRRTAEGYDKFTCPSPDYCDLGNSDCKPYGRMNVVITPEENTSEDPIGTFVFRTSGFNSIRTLSSRLQYFKALSGNRLSCLPLALKVRGKSTRQSYGHPIYYVDLTLRKGKTFEETLQKAKQVENHRNEMGFDQSALDAAASNGFANGRFEDDQDTIESVLEEFYPNQKTSLSAAENSNQGLLDQLQSQSNNSIK